LALERDEGCPVLLIREVDLDGAGGQEGAAHQAGEDDDVLPEEATAGCHASVRGSPVHPDNIIRSRGTDLSRQRVISSRQARKTSSPWVAGSSISPSSPTNSRRVKTGRPRASSKASSICFWRSVIVRITSASASRWRCRFRSVEAKSSSA